MSVDDVMTEMGLGPNGSLIFCMEYLLEDDSGWFAEQLEGYMEVSMGHCCVAGSLMAV